MFPLLKDNVLQDSQISGESAKLDLPD